MRRRLVAAIAGVAVVAVVLLAIPLGIVLGHRYRDEELLRLQRDTVAATRSIDIGRRSSDPIELPSTRDRLGVYDRAGRLVAGRGPSTAPALVRRALAGGRVEEAAAAGTLEVAVPLVHGERLSGAMQATRADDAAARDARRAWLVIVAGALAIIALAVTAAVVLGQRLAAPLERLAASARRLGDGDFSARARPAGIPEVDAVGGALASTARRLEDLIGRERAFTADASHQLRTPLQALRIQLETMELNGDASPELGAALTEVDRLEATIETLLALSRGTPGERPPAGVDPLMVRVRDRWAGVLAARARPLRVVVDASGMAVRASAGVAGEILDVLVGNAVQHGDGAVTVSVRATGDWMTFEVADEGPGIAVHEEDVFTRGVGAGHGIGLALARSLAEAEGGRLALMRAGSSPVFQLTVPAATQPGVRPTRPPSVSGT